MGRSEKGVIFNIKRFAVHDGHGIRTAVFLKGCPLNCIWCHNPEGISQNISIWYNKNICIACGRCVEVCPEKALSLQDSDNGMQVQVNNERCRVSGECVLVCPTGAIDFTGKQITVGELMNEVLKDQKYFRMSGGGVTLTGGEPLFQPEFTVAILRECKENNLDTAIETSLYCEKEILDRVIPYTDHFIADLKIFDPYCHEQFTGRNNSLIKKNLEYLIRSGRNVTVRIPLIPEVTDSYENREAVIEFVRSIDKDVPLEFLDYNHLTGSKYRKLGIPYFLDSKP